MKTEQHASKILRDSYFYVGGKKIKLPTKYYQYKIGEIASKMGFDIEKVSDDDSGVKYELSINSTCAKDMVDIIGCILYGRNFLYNPITRPLSYIYRKYKTRQLFHKISNEDIAIIFIEYVKAIGIGNFTTVMTYIEGLIVAKKD